MSKLKQQISEYLKKTQYGKTLERLSKNKRPCRNDGVLLCEKIKENAWVYIIPSHWTVVLSSYLEAVHPRTLYLT